MRTIRFSLACVISLVVATAATCQVTVDATGPIREMKRQAVSGSGGSIGRKLLLQVSINIPVLAPDSSGRSVVEFVLRNSGNSDIMLPISPHPGDFEPSDPKLPYSVLRLGLRILLVKGSVIIPGGADLYGNRALGGTLTVLAPGTSIRVLTRVGVPGGGVNLDESFRATASLESETMKTIDGKLASESQDLGFATSRPFTFGEFVKGQ